MIYRGDVVRLRKVKGPEMEVTDVHRGHGGTTAEVRWFDKDQRLHTATFKETELEKADGRV